MLYQPFVCNRREDLLGARAGLFQGGLKLDDGVHDRTLHDARHLHQAYSDGL